MIELEPRAKERPPIRIALADDHPLFLSGVAELFSREGDCEIVARVANGEQALKAVRELAPDVLVLDLRMPVKDGLAVIREIERDRLSTRVVVLTGVEGAEVLDAIRLGARGVVLKHMAPTLLVQAVREVHAGGKWIEKGAAMHAVNHLLHREAALREVANALTARELQIARMAASGLRNKAVAKRLDLAEGTVKTYLHNVYEKLGVDGRVALARCLRRRGLD